MLVASRHKSGGSTAHVQQALRECGLRTVVREMPATTRTAKEAAEAIGCGVGQIAKSLVFRGRESGRPLLVIEWGCTGGGEVSHEHASHYDCFTDSALPPK